MRDKSYRFSLEAIRLYRELGTRREYVLSRQMVRAATSVGANIEEARAGYSRADFAAKMGIASKEAREAQYWLRLIRNANLASAHTVDPLLEMADELVRMLTAIVKSTRAGPFRSPPPKLETRNSKLKTQNSKLRIGAA